MADDIMAVDERVTKLEVTVAQGFAELGGRLDRVEERFDRVESRLDRIEGRLDRLDARGHALNAKLDVVAESLDAKLQLVLERIDGLSRELRVTTEAIVQEHRADRRLMYVMLADHGVRISALEHDRRALSLPDTADPTGSATERHEP